MAPAADIVSIAAWLAPARRAAHTDPVEALKQT
jgi:ABC-type lipoprotein release transport system permease subunit